MQYIYYIEESQTWTCPKSGRWKVICVGAGSSGTFATNSNTNGYGKGLIIPVNGGSTSFGNYLSVNGGSVTQALVTSNSTANGIGGYDLFQYGGAGTDRLGGHDGTAGYGYGAGGGAVSCVLYITEESATTTTNATINGVSGECGQIRTGTFDLSINENIICVIGKSNTIDNDDIVYAVANLPGTEKKYTLKDSANVFNSFTQGHDGVIILQYLGE